MAPCRLGKVDTQLLDSPLPSSGVSAPPGETPYLDLVIEELGGALEASEPLGLLRGHREN